MWVWPLLFCGISLTSALWTHDLHAEPLPQFLEEEWSGRESFETIDLRVDLFQTSFSVPGYPCFAVFKQLALIFRSIQAGGTCSFRTGQRHSLSVTAIPEISFRSSSLQYQIRPGLIVGLTQNFQIKDSGNPSIVFLNIQTKIVPKESLSSEVFFSKSELNAALLQHWDDILQSHYSLGFLKTFKPALFGKQTWTLKTSYLESLPLTVRRWGGLQSMAALNYKRIDLAARTRNWNITWGAGANYGILVADSVRVSAFFPTFYFGYDF